VAKQSTKFRHSNQRLVEARKLVDKMHKKGKSPWIRFFYPEKAEVAERWANQAGQDLYVEESKETTQSLSEDHPQIQVQSCNKDPLTKKIELSKKEKEILSNVRMDRFVIPFFIGIGIIASSPSWLPKVADVTNDEAWLCFGIALAIYFFTSLRVMAEHWNYSLAQEKWIIKDGETDSITTIDHYNKLVEYEKVPTIF
jgi:hypothetical protein